MAPNDGYLMTIRPMEGGAHATNNFGRVSDRDLQEQMGHATFSRTKQRYIKYAEIHQQRVYNVFLPKSLKVKANWVFIE